ncbi:MAG: FecR domain-containing protein [Chitinophagaceae bacterium]|nr:FecR domain-containing protein [Chitinophagaceae bacterium]
MNNGVSKDQIKALAEKWMQGTLSAEERAIFENWYNHNEGAEVQWPGNETEKELRNRMYNTISTELKEEESAGRTVLMRRWWMAAAAVLLLVSGSLIWHVIAPRKSQPAVATQQPQASEKLTGFIRHITLPDGTRVVLQANSQLDYPEKFMGNAREVVLSGEAYFDVAEDKRKPFIIYTGRVRTTVLGTALNIRALPDDKKITVSVTTGKVKVEDDRRLLAVLTPNQRVTYQPVTAAVSKDTVNAISLVTDWTKHEMVFEGQSFEEVAVLVGRRYGVEILFKNEGLKKCTIKAFFDGTETLENVLNVLCIISNAHRSMSDGRTVLLDGEGCGGQ